MQPYSALQRSPYVGPPGVSCVPDPYYGPFSRAVTFQEDFESGITDYITVLGNRAIHTVSTDTYGQTINIAAQNSPSASAIQRNITSGRMDRLTFYFQIVASNPDDAPSLSVGGYTFAPRREAFFDALRRPTMNGVVVASTGLAVGIWYFADMRVQGAAMVITLTNMSTLVSTTATIAAAAVAPVAATEVLFFSDASGLTSPVKYAGIRIHTDNPHTALTLGGDTLTDTSSDQKTVTVVGAVVSSAVKKPYGERSLFFNGSGGRLQIANSDEFNFWAGDFTIRMKILFDAVGAFSYNLVSKRTGAGFGQFSILYASGQILARFDGNTADGTWLVNLAGSQTLLANTWYDYEVNRSGSTFSHYLNGALIESTSVTPGTALANQAADIWVGANSDGTSGLNGYIKDLQITKGVARNIAAFAPPSGSFCAFPTPPGTINTTPIPAPTPSPSPAPSPAPIAFAVAAVPRVDFTIAAAISPARTLATITTAEATAIVRADVAIPGLTFNVVGSPVTSITVTGTPTVAAVNRVVLTYTRADGTVLGSSIHTINVIDPAVLFAAGLCASLSARVGQTLDVVLCSPTIALRVESVAISQDRGLACELKTVGGVESRDLLEWVWTPGATSSGVLRAKGVVAPSAIGSYTLTVTYRTPGWPSPVLGTSVHTINITPAATAAPPAPAPAPAPPAPAPAPSPSPPPAPAPSPLPAADPLIASVLGLWRFDTITSFGSAFVTPGTIGPLMLGSFSLTNESAVGRAAQDVSRGVRAVTAAPWPTAPAEVTVEAAVLVRNFEDLGRVGSTSRFIPLVSCVDASESSLIWSLGYGGWDVIDAGAGFARRRAVQLCFVRVNQSSGAVVTAISPGFSDPAGLDSFNHVAGQFAPGYTASWWAGRGSSSIAFPLAAADGLTPAGSRIVVGGRVPRFSLPGGPAEVISMNGVIDELRITAAARYSVAGAFTMAIPAASLQLPFPNY